MKKNIWLAVVICVSSGMAFFSCQHKPLWYLDPYNVTVKVEFDWRNAPDGDPRGMCVFFYPVEFEGQVQRRYDFTGREGGEIEIPIGKYHVLCYNNDTEAVQFRGHDRFHSHEAHTREGDIFESIFGSSSGSATRSEEDERVMITPDMLWGSNVMDVEITRTGLSYVVVPEKDKEPLIQNPTENKEHVITLYPAELVCTYTYEILNVQNLDHATQMCATLSGMSHALTVGTEELHSEPITHPLEAFSDEVSTITGKFYTFGHHEENEDIHRMLLYVWMKDGSRYYFGSGVAAARAKAHARAEGRTGEDIEDKFDVTDQVHTAPNKRRVHIVIDGLDLPQPMSEDNQFIPSVDDWRDVEEDIYM